MRGGCARRIELRSAELSVISYEKAPATDDDGIHRSRPRAACGLAMSPHPQLAGRFECRIDWPMAIDAFGYDRSNRFRFFG
jgi:hypothetical protein